MNKKNVPRYLVVLLVYVLAACTPVGEGPSTMPLEDLFKNDNTVFAQAFERSGLLSTVRVENYPLTIFYISEEEFTSYLLRERADCAELSSE